MSIRTLSLTLLPASASPALALAQHAPHKTSGVDAVRRLYERLGDLYLKSAELMPEGDYAFRPTVPPSAQGGA